MPRSIVSFLALLILSGAPTYGQGDDLAKKFGERESFDGVALSPDGTKISYLNPIAGKGTALIVVDIKTGTLKPVLSSGDPSLRLAWCDWVKADRIACGVSGERVVVGENFNVSRIVAVNADGGNIKELGARQSSRAIGINSFGGRIIDYLPDDPDNILMTVYKLPEDTSGTLMSNSEGGMTVAMVNVRTGRSRNIEPLEPNGGAFVTDRRGRVRLKNIIDFRDSASGSYYAQGATRWVYRTKQSNEWRSLGTTDLRVNGGFRVLGLDDSGDNVLALKPKDGRQALYRIALDGSNREELLAAHPKVDIDGLKRLGRYARPVGARYSTDYNHVDYFDPVLTKLTVSLGRVLPGKPEISIIDETWDGSKLLIFAGSDVDPGAYYLFDKANKSLGKLSPARPAIDGMKLGAMRPVSYPARDGVAIPGYLTLPPDKARGLPAIIMPHGGPSARDTWGFDWLSQYFSSLGYAVLKANYRGSAGYGEAWLQQNGFKAWRTSMTDINDGARWLVSQGIADPNRIAIFGWSYGGYAALQANVIEPNLYKAAIAVAPVTDLAMLKEQDRFFGTFLLTKDFIGAGSHVVEGSPVKNAAAIRTPVLMFHGTNDFNVEVRQSHAMESALRAAGKKVELVTYPGLEHSLIDSTARADMLLKSAKFLEANVN